MAEDEQKKKAARPDLVFSKKPLATSARFADYQDVLNTLLDEGAVYTIAETISILQGFLKH